MDIQEITQRWEETGLLNGISTDRKDAIAACLQTQAEFNESDGQRCPATFLRCSIPIVRRVLANTKNVFTNNFDEQVGNTNFHIFRTTWNPFAKQSPTENHNLDIEADYCAEVAQSIKEELDEVFSDTPAHVNFYGFSANDDNNGQIIIFYV